MTIEKIHLQKLLQIFYAPDNLRRTLLRGDIRSEIQRNIKKQNGEDTSGGHFHTPFWYDVRGHVAGKRDLRDASKERIAENKRSRQRLYPALTTGFLTWWDEKRRWRNEEFELIPQNINTRLQIADLNAVVKIEHLLAFKVGDQFNRIVYPYFSERPTLPEEGGRIGLWVLGEALANYDRNDMRILDVLRSRSFALIDSPLQGNERDLFLRKYEAALSQWNRLRGEYK